MNETTILNNTNFNGSHQYYCEECGHRFKTENYHQMVAISHGSFKYCPKCGREIVGYKIDGVPLNKSGKYAWAMGWNT